VLSLPRLYPILDASCFATDADLFRFVEQLASAGITFLQYRNKRAAAPQVLAQARELRRRFPSLTWIMNDRADLCVAAEFDGVHVGQEDLSPEGARLVIGHDRQLGVSTHNLAQVRAAEATSTNYIAIGPIFTTSSKTNPDPVVGLEGVRSARDLTRKPLVAIGGITRQNCESVLAAGADSVAIISDLLDTPRQSAEDFLRRLG
jgi:thiamine-phosphate pyrophosphorylase